MDDKTTKIILTIAVVSVLLYFVVLRPQTASKVATKIKPPASAGPGTSFAQDVNAFANLLKVGGGFFKSSSSAAVPTSTTGPVASGFAGERGLNDSGTDDPALSSTAGPGTDESTFDTDVLT